MGARFLEDGLVVPGCYTAFSNKKQMVTILRREIECKVGKVKHMRLEVLQLKTKTIILFTNENFARSSVTFVT